MGFDGETYRKIQEHLPELLASNPASGGPGSSVRLAGPAATVVALGDSITVRNCQGGGGVLPIASLPNQLGAGYLQMGCAVLNQRLRYAGVFGAGGQTSTVILNTYLPLVLAMSPLPGWCIVQTNFNDYGAMTFAQSMANHVSMARQLKAAGVQPVMATQTPGTGKVSAQRLWDQQQCNYIRKFCEVNGIPFLDFYAATINPATGDFQAAYNDDNTHPSPAGFWAMAQEFLKLPLAPYGPPITWESADQVNLLANGTMQGAGPVATSWSVATAGTGFTDSTVAGDPGIAGQWQQTVSTQNSTHVLSQTLNGGSGTLWSDGDVLAMMATVSVSGSAGGVYPRVRAYLQPTVHSALLMYDTGSGSTPAMRAWAVDMDRAASYLEFVVEAGTWQIVVELSATAGAGVVKFGQVALINLTAQGLRPSQMPVI